MRIQSYACRGQEGGGAGLILATTDVLILATFACLFGHAKVAPLTWGGRMFEWFPTVGFAYGV